MPTILFLHANSFPTGVYRQFLNALRAQLPSGTTLEAPAGLFTDPALPAHERWPNMLQQVLSIIDSQPAKSFILLGHSMGGYLSVQAAAQRLNRVEHVILLDAPIVHGWKRLFMNVIQPLGLGYYGGPAPIAAKRRFQWDSEAQARSMFAAKRFVQRWHDGVLQDYLDHGLVALPDGSRRLKIPRETECDIYAHVIVEKAWKAFRQLKQQNFPLTYIAGKYSAESRLTGYSGLRKLFGQKFKELAAGHLLPLEKPSECAHLVLQCYLENQKRVN